MFIAGHVGLVLLYLLLLLAFVPAWLACVGSLALLGTYYAATDGVLSATAAEFLPLPSPQGHDAFLVDIERFGPAVRNFLSGL